MSYTSPIINFESVDKFYGNFHALKDITISVNPGERMVICGPSGSGKSTLIRCINGLENHNSGKLTVDGVEVFEGSKDIIRLRQEIGMVFQQFNLFPHLTVLENLTIGPIKA
jgi:general L-amino acid transport system ATP-binding protein